MLRLWDLVINERNILAEHRPALMRMMGAVRYTGRWLW